jgi:cysteinyl-tRNA synthetase
LLIPQEEKVPAEVLELLEARTAARAEKNWAESDRIRDALAEKGWTVKDTPEGPKPRKI